MSSRTSHPTDPSTPLHPAVEQLSLLPRVLTEPQVPVQFRLDRRTRERGLAQVAALRQQLQQRRQQRGVEHHAA